MRRALSVVRRASSTAYLLRVLPLRVVRLFLRVSTQGVSIACPAVVAVLILRYSKYLFKVPIVATANYSTKNLNFLETHDWLSKPGNRTVVHFSSSFADGGA